MTQESPGRQTVTARTSEVGGLGPADRKSSGVRSSGDMLLTYDLTAVAADVEEVVRNAGGWLCDRARAGWQVTVLVPPGSDTRALTILGLRAGNWEPGESVLGPEPPAAVAVGADVLDHHDRLRREVLAGVGGAGIEITVWGESPLFAADPRFGRVQHPLSVAARAFKARALRPSGTPSALPAVEQFRSCALWYPPEGSDLVPVSSSR
ncbi:hypothetical protein GCM10027535_42290 [Mycolicibacterium hippocampi]|uniref:Uncharacterized protein n=1 Tax=Mycolicibacterium hippocampi TaxID=659824 RepID=A0A7I9ZNB8_9MYCO|nr:hypothetical protein MHIP_30250 [Mycolicibacterium hippocampi]